jgi:hypothetical protein
MVDFPFFDGYREDVMRDWEWWADHQKEALRLEWGTPRGIAWITQSVARNPFGHNLHDILDALGPQVKQEIYRAAFPEYGPAKLQGETSVSEQFSTVSSPDASTGQGSADLRPVSRGIVLDPVGQ